MAWNPASDILSQSSVGYSNSRDSQSRARFFGASFSTQSCTIWRNISCSSVSEKSMGFLS